MMNKIILSMLMGFSALWAGFYSDAQTDTLQMFKNGATVWGDFDNDGDLDFILTSTIGYGKPSTLYMKNQGHGFSKINGQFGTHGGTAIDTGDFDNDGDPDLVIMGYDDTAYTVSVFRNDSGSFTLYQRRLDSLNAGYVAWGDMDNDLDLDLVISGTGRWDGTRNPEFTRVYKNEDDSLRFYPSVLPDKKVSVGWADFDGDGDQDLLAGDSIYVNSGSTFTSAISPGNELDELASYWFDYNQDGHPDICGDNGYIYLNNGVGEFDTIRFRDIYFGSRFLKSSCWGDFDNDGDLDLLVENTLYRNTPSFVGMVKEPEEFIKSYESGIDFVDYDNDGDLDIYLNGRQGVKLYRNDYMDCCAGSSPPLELDNLGHITVILAEYNDTIPADIYIKAPVDLHLISSASPGGAVTLDREFWPREVLRFSTVFHGEGGDYEHGSYTRYARIESTAANVWMIGFESDRDTGHVWDYEDVVLRVEFDTVRHVTSVETLVVDTGSQVFDLAETGVEILHADSAGTIIVYFNPGVFPPVAPDSFIFLKRYYEIHATNMDSMQAVLTLHYTQPEFEASGLPAESLLSCYRFADGAWQLMPSKVDTAANTVTCTTNGFSMWGIGGVMPVPVTGIRAVRMDLSAGKEGEITITSHGSYTQFQFDGEQVSFISVCDIQGRTVENIPMLRQGLARWEGCDGNGLPVGPGIYYCRYRYNGVVRYKKFIRF